MKKPLSLVTKLVISLIVLGMMISYLISSGMWNTSVVSLTQHVLGSEAAENVDQGARAGVGAGEDFVREAASMDAQDLIDQANEIELPSFGRAPKYDRDKFGNGWSNDEDGCSTRELVLMRDLDNTTMRDDRKCKVWTGTLNPDPYVGANIAFDSKEDPQSVQIDHVVPLSVAWKMGAHEWNDKERVAFSNDQSNLLASDGPANASKGDKTPDKWMPKNKATTCEYASIYVDVVDTYSLSMEASTRDHLIETLEQC